MPTALCTYFTSKVRFMRIVNNSAVHCLSCQLESRREILTASMKGFKEVLETDLLAVVHKMGLDQHLLACLVASIVVAANKIPTALRGKTLRVGYDEVSWRFPKRFPVSIRKRFDVLMTEKPLLVFWSHRRAKRKCNPRYVPRRCCWHTADSGWNHGFHVALTKYF